MPQWSLALAFSCQLCVFRAEIDNIFQCFWVASCKQSTNPAGIILINLGLFVTWNTPCPGPSQIFGYMRDTIRLYTCTMEALTRILENIAWYLACLNKEPVKAPTPPQYTSTGHSHKRPQQPAGWSTVVSLQRAPRHRQLKWFAQMHTGSIWSSSNAEPKILPISIENAGLQCPIPNKFKDIVIWISWRIGAN